MPERRPVHFRGTERFELLSLLGRGASGVVYEALDRERGGHVALKVLGERSPEAIAHFKHEFRALQEIRHPNLVELKELVFEGGHWLLSMQLVRGVDIVAHAWGEMVTGADEASPKLAASAEDDTIRSWERRRAPEGVFASLPRVFSEARVRASFAQLASGLSALHAEGKIHRDVKRSNVLVDARGLVTIVDFGLVADLDGVGAIAQEGLAGTPATMAPEQAALERIGPPSDWYSFGAVLYQALTGRAPFVGTRTEILEQKQRTLPLRPAALVKTVPPDLSDLCMDLLAIDPAQRPEGASVVARLSGTATRPVTAGWSRPGKDDGIFVGRSAELAMLGATLERVARGESVTVVLEGESGVGKTSLLREFLAAERERRPELCVLAGRCFERESLPYKALDGVLDAVVEHVRKLPCEEAEALLPPDAAEIARAFPILHRLRERSQWHTGSEDVDPHARRLRVFAALRSLFMRLAARRPTVVVMDDMQWADIDSMAMLSALLQPPAPAMLWLVSRRPGASISRLPLPGKPSLLRLGCLTQLESDALVTELLGVPGEGPIGSALSLRIEEAGGHPLFLREIARQIGASSEHAATLGLDDALWERVCALEPTTRRFLELTAVAGRPVAQGVVADALLSDVGPTAVTGLAPREQSGVAQVLDQLSELRHGCLICTTGTHPNDTVETYHDRVREAVLARLAAQSKLESHRSLASALERAGGGDAEALAEHWGEAGEPERAFGYAVTAAERAASALAFERAARWFRQALELLSPDAEGRGDLERKLGDALANAGRGHEAARIYRAAAQRAQGLESVALERAAGEQLLRSGHVEEGIRTVSAALRRLGIGSPTTRALSVLSLGFLRLRIRLRRFRYRPRAEAELSSLERARLDGGWMAATCLQMFDGVRSAELQCRTSLRALRAGTPLHVARAHVAEAVFLALAGQSMRPRIERSLAAASALDASIGDPLAHGWLSVHRGAIAFFLGDWAESETQCERAEAIFAERPGTSFELASARAFRVWAGMMRGRFGVALERVPDYVSDAENRGDLYAATYQMTSFSNVAWLRRDDIGEARRMLALAESRWPSKHFDVPRYSNMVAAAHIELYAGRPLVAFERVRRDWAPLRWGVAFRAQITRFGMRYVRGVAALAAYDEYGKPALLRDAADCARAIAAERVTWSECFAALVRAGVERRRGNLEAALSAFLEAETKATDKGMLLHRAIARQRRAELIGGDEARALSAETLAFMREQKIQNPERMLAML